MDGRQAGTQPACGPHIKTWTETAKTAQATQHPELQPQSTSATMLLDTRAMRYLTAEDWRVLTAVCSHFHFPHNKAVVARVQHFANTGPLTPPPR